MAVLCDRVPVVEVETAPHLDRRPRPVHRLRWVDAPGDLPGGLPALRRGARGSPGAARQRHSLHRPVRSDTEVLFDRICRENGIDHLLTAPRRPQRTGKIERFHESLRKEFLVDRTFLRCSRPRPSPTRVGHRLQHDAPASGARDGDAGRELPARPGLGRSGLPVDPAEDHRVLG